MGAGSPHGLQGSQRRRDASRDAGPDQEEAGRSRR